MQPISLYQRAPAREHDDPKGAIIVHVVVEHCAQTLLMCEHARVVTRVNVVALHERVRLLRDQDPRPSVAAHLVVFNGRLGAGIQVHAGLL